jgi:hypothetical protein
MIDACLKKYTGTLLLGARTNNRSLILNEIKHSGLLDEFVVSYFERTTSLRSNKNYNHLFFRTPILNQLDTQEFLECVFESDGSGNTCRPTQECKFGQHRWVSQIIPYNIYNLGYVSVIAETESDSDCFFLSEKTAKPLLLGQPFIMFNGHNSLKILRDFGFKTFSPWIDESYDNIANGSKRAVAVAHSAIQFSQLPKEIQLQYFLEMQPILQHNRLLSLNKTWLMKNIADAIINFSNNLSIV